MTVEGWLVHVNLADGTFAYEGSDPPVHWDAGAGRLELIRDRTGLLPLFCARREQTIIAGSDLRQVVSTVRARPCVRTLSAWLHGGAIDPSETLFEEVRRVPAGHVLEVTHDRERLRRDWEPPAPGTYGIKDARRFGETLEGAVSHVAGGTTPAVFLSGGLDSAAVIVAAAAETSPVALCVDFAGASEATTQRTVAEAVGARRIDAQASASAELVQEARALARDSLWPTSAVWAPAFEQLAEEARIAGAGVLLDGLGGDELLDAGYAAGRALLTRPWWLPFWLVAERRYAGSTIQSLRALTRYRASTFAEARRRDLIDARLAMQREDTFDRGLRTGLPRCHPLWDADVVDLLHGVPPEALVMGGHPKSPARAYVRQRVPVINGPWPRPKVADALAASVEAELNRVLEIEGTPCLAALGVVDSNRPSGPLPFGRIWPMLSLDSWLQGVESWGEHR